MDPEEAVTGGVVAVEDCSQEEKNTTEEDKNKEEDEIETFLKYFQTLIKKVILINPFVVH